MHPKMLTRLKRLEDLQRSVTALLEELDRIGFDDEDSPVSGADAVDVLCLHIGRLRRLSREG